jgi:hypothetical protein
MASAAYYRVQAQRCLLLSRAAIDLNARLWLTDMASYYVAKARAADDRGGTPQDAPPVLASGHAA